MSVKLAIIALSLTVACGHEVSPFDPSGSEAAENIAFKEAGNPGEALAPGFYGYEDDYSVAITGAGSAAVNVIKIGQKEDDVEYLTGLLERAQAARIEALARARRDHAIAAAIRAQLVDAEREIAAIRHRLARHDRIKARIATRGRSLENIWRGDARPVVLNAMTYFFAEAGVSQADLIRREFAGVGAENFRARHAGQDSLAFPGGNALSYLEFLRQNRLDVVVGSDAHLYLAELYDLISDAAANAISTHRARQNEIRAERERVWGPLERFVAAVASGEVFLLEDADS